MRGCFLGPLPQFHHEALMFLKSELFEEMRFVLMGLTELPTQRFILMSLTELSTQNKETDKRNYVNRN